MWLADGRLWMYARCCSRLIVLRVRLIVGRSSGWCVPMGTGAPALAPKPTAPGERPDWAYGTCAPAHGPPRRNAVLWVVSGGLCPWRQLEESTEEAAVRHAEEEADRGRAETEDQSEALAGRLRDPLAVGAGEDAHQARPGAEQRQVVEHRRDERGDPQHQGHRERRVLEGVGLSVRGEKASGGVGSHCLCHRAPPAED